MFSQLDAHGVTRPDIDVFPDLCSNNPCTLEVVFYTFLSNLFVVVILFFSSPKIQLN